LPAIIANFKEVKPFSISETLDTKAGKFHASLFPGCPAAGIVLKIEGGGQTIPKRAVIGIFYTPREFANKAKKLRHPVESTLDIQGSIREDILEALSLGPEFVTGPRRKMLRSFMDKAQNLKPDELKMHRTLNSGVETIFEDKNFLPRRELDKIASYRDESIMDEVIAGFDVVGTSPTSPACPSQLVQAKFTAQDPECHAPPDPASLPLTIESSGGPKGDAEMWTKAVQEAKEEHLRDLVYRQAEVTGSPSTASWSPSRSFGRKQGGTKVRRIDGLSGENANVGYTTSNRLDLVGGEEVVSIAKVIADCISEDGTASFEQSTKEKLQGELHHSLSREEAAKWMGKTVGLSDAYKPMMWRESSRRFAALRVGNAEGKSSAYLISYTMNFGACASGCALNRAARSMWWIDTALLKLGWTPYADDYPVMSLSRLNDNTVSTMKIFLSGIGGAAVWGSAKDVKFSNGFTALGVQIDLRGQANHLLFLTDRAAEDGEQRVLQYTTCGALIIDAAASEQRYFGLEIEEEIVALWSKGGKRRVITKAELYTFIVSRMALQAKLVNRRCLPFVDDDNNRDNLISAFSRSAIGLHSCLSVYVDFVSPIPA
jgi:hypothetical protein